MSSDNPKISLIRDHLNEVQKLLDELWDFIGEDNPKLTPGPLGFCPKCKSPLVVKNGSRGEFIGCSGYPNCRFTKNIETNPEPF